MKGAVPLLQWAVLTKNQGLSAICFRVAPSREATMTQQRYIVKLTIEERERLEGRLKRGKHTAAVLTKVRILLPAYAEHPQGGRTDAEICTVLSLQKNRPEEVRKGFVEKGLEQVLRAWGKITTLFCYEELAHDWGRMV
jgi:hypothetical protein